jgi:hypothetical protein
VETIGVQITGEDAAFIASAKEAAAAVNKIADAEQKVAAAAKELGVDGKKFAQEFARVEKRRVADQERASKKAAADSSKAAKTETAGVKKTAAEERKAVVAQERATKLAAAARAKEEKKAAADRKKADKDARDARAKQAAGMKEALGATVAVAGAVAGVTVALGGAALAAVYLGAKLVAAGLNAAELRENARGFFNVLTAGRGTKELENVDHLAGQLGVKFNDARQQFIQFRQAGLDNRQSAKLIKLAADLNTVDHSGELARQAIARVLSYTSPNGLQTPEQLVAADKAMALLAKQAGVTGKGIEAARESTTTLVGALNRIDNVKTTALETLGERVKPSIDKAASSVANLVEKVASSEQGKQAIDSFAKAVTVSSDAIAAAVPRVEQAWNVLKRTLDDPKARAAISDLGTAASVAGSGIRGFADGVLAVQVPMLAMKDTAVAAAEGIGKLALKAVEILPAMYNAGKNIVSGLAHGIAEATPGAVSAIVDLAARMSEGFRKRLDMHSPSRVFIADGKNIGEGVRRGAVASMPTGAELAAMVRPPTVANDNGQAWANKASKQSRATQIRDADKGNDARATGGLSYGAPGGGTYEINLIVQEGTPSGDIRSQVFSALDEWWARKLAQKGAA